MNATLWTPAASAPALSPGDVHLWRAELAREPKDEKALYALLNETERLRAARFHFDRDRRKYTIGRGVLRVLLGGYLQRSPESLSFLVSAYGKPSLPPDENLLDLRFNVSHSGELAVYAFTLGREVGVDIEFQRANVDYLALAEHVFSPNERATLRALPEAQRQGAFFACWSRKEAFIKAKGLGLSLPLDSFDVSLAPEEPAALLTTRDAPNEASRWTLSAFDPGFGCAGALCIEGVAATPQRFAYW